MRLSDKGGNPHFDAREVQPMCRSAAGAGRAGGKLARRLALGLAGGFRGLSRAGAGFGDDILAAKAENEFAIDDVPVHEGEAGKDRSHDVLLAGRVATPCDYRYG